MAGVAEFAVAVLEISPDSVLTLLVAGIIGVGDRESLEGSELGLDEVEQEACVGVQTGWMRSFLSRLRNRG